jgi:predicted alpha/beta superfamily hydrolase
MKIKLQILVYVAAIFSIVPFDDVTGQQYNHITSPEKYVVMSDYNGKSYTIQVSLPRNFTKSDNSKSYKVLYVLDGNYSFNIYQSARAIMDLGKEIEEIIIVGIDVECDSDNEWLINRHRDYTFSHQPQADKMWSKILNLPEDKLISGGADLFLKTLEYNIIPFIETNYNTQPERGITGHSLSGLFAAYCLFAKPALFSSYGVNSPSLWWNDFEINKIEKDFFENQGHVKANVFFSVGSLEGDIMTGPCRKLGETLINRKYDGLKIESQLFEKETHLSVSLASSSRTLKVLYTAINRH